MESFFIGAANDCHLIVEDLEEQHAELRLLKNEVILHRLGEALIRVNERELESSAVLRPGDRFVLNEQLFCFGLDVSEDGQESPFSPIWEIFDGPSSHESEALPESAPSSDGIEWLTRIRELRECAMEADSINDYEALLELFCDRLVDLFSALSASAVLFEEDGKNPAFAVKRFRRGYQPAQSEKDRSSNTAQRVARIEVDEGVITRTLEERGVVALELSDQGDDYGERYGLATPITHQRRAIGLLHIDRPKSEPKFRTIDEELIELAARLLAYPISHLLD
jgi:hypothetical protein